MTERASLLKTFTEYRLVKRFTQQPRRMSEAYNTPINREQAFTLLLLVMMEWPPYVPNPDDLSPERIRIIWNRKDGRARGGFYRYKDKLRPFLRLPIKRLTAGLLLHEYCHVLTLYGELEERNSRGVKRRSPHGPVFRSMFDMLLVCHQQDWINVTRDTETDS